jgi:multidrug resistance efflux pump
MEDPRPLPPIPVPPSQRWREVRLLYLPRIVFLLGVIGTALLWSRWVTPATLVAEAEAMQAEVRAAQGGMLVGLKVAAFQAVAANEVVGHVAVVDPKVLDATLAVIRAEVGMLAATMTGATDRQRVALEFERLQLDWMSGRVELASLRGKLQIVEADLTRLTPLHRGGMITNEQFDQLKANRETLAEQVAEQAKLVARLEPFLRTLAPAEGQTAALSTESALASAIKVQDAKLKLAEQQLTPVPLLSPIAGVVSVVLRRNGETVVAGEPILRIVAARPDRLSGFLRQPLPFEPKVGMPVEIRSRSTPRVSAASKIVAVGPTMEPLTPTLISAMHLPPTPVPEPGLKIQVAIPTGFVVRPGEFVDVISP